MASSGLRRLSEGHWEDLAGCGRVISTPQGNWVGVTPLGQRSPVHITIAGAHRWLKARAAERKTLTVIESEAS